MPEEPEYLSLKEVAEYLGIKRASIYYYIKALDVKPEKFEHNKNAYLPIEVVKRMKEIKEQPWKAKEVKNEQTQPPQPTEYQVKSKPARQRGSHWSHVVDNTD